MRWLWLLLTIVLGLAVFAGLLVLASGVVSWPFSIGWLVVLGIWGICLAMTLAFW